VVSPGTALASLQSVDPIFADFWLPQKALAEVQPGQAVRMKTDIFPTASWEGTVSVVNTEVDLATRNVRVRATVPNADGRLKPGLFCRVTLYTGPPKKTVVVPINALLYDNAVTKLFVAEGDRAKERKVKIGLKYGEFIEILEGVKDKETVVTVGQNNLMEGVLLNVAR